jgi:predicted RNase H-like HicB family nuclease
MKLKVIVHDAEEGGYWAEVPSIPGCATQGESFEELRQNLYEAVEACLSVDLVDLDAPEASGNQQVIEIAVEAIAAAPLRPKMTWDSLKAVTREP